MTTETLLNHRARICRRMAAAEARCTWQLDTMAFKKTLRHDTVRDELFLVQLELNLSLMREHEQQAYFSVRPGLPD